MDSCGPLLATHFLLEKQVEARAASLDHLVGELLQMQRHIEAQRLGGLEVDHQLVLGWRLHRKVGRFLALENLIDVTGCATIRITVAP
jgi:hypothetical protein